MVRALHLHFSRWLHIIDICCTAKSSILWLWLYCRQLANLLSGYRENIPCFMEWDDWLARLMERLWWKPVTLPRALSVDPYRQICSWVLLHTDLIITNFKYHWHGKYLKLWKGLPKCDQLQNIVYSCITRELITFRISQADNVFWKPTLPFWTSAQICSWGQANIFAMKAFIFFIEMSKHMCWWKRLQDVPF